MLRPAYRFFDITGDLKPDLVVTTACDDVAIGLWITYRNKGTAFDLSPVSYLIPAAIASKTPLDLSAALSCAGGATQPAFQSLALVHASWDLVVTASCSDAVGSTRWLVYEPACP